MEFIKKHLISLLCGVAGLAFVGATVWGMFQTGAIEELEKRKGKINEIRGFESKPINQAVIDAEKKRGAMFEAEFKATIDVAEKINKREPLMPGVFPRAESKDVAPYAFRDQYGVAIGQLSVKLSAGGLPTAVEIAEEQENVNDLIQMEKELAEPEGGRKKDPNAAPTPQPQPQPAQEQTFTRFGESSVSEFGEGPAGFGRGRMGGGMGGGGGGGGNSPLIPNGPPKYDARYRAHVNKAKSILCYADEKAFHVSPIYGRPSPPTEEEMWKAQVSLWVQQDVVNAIAALNGEAASAVTEGDANVEHTPVKRIERLKVYGYLMKENKPYDFEDRGWENVQREALAPAESFTGKCGDDQFDVIRFGVLLVADQRDLPRVIDRITKANFYKCVECDYRALTEQEQFEGYLYGTAPVVRARLEFEGYLARSLYAKLMPDVVKKALGVPIGEQNQGGG